MKRGFWRQKKVLITGHEGFLGSHIAKTLLDYGADVIGLDKVANRPLSVLNGLRQHIVSLKGNIVNLKLVKELIAEYRPQVVFHLAAEPIVGVAYRNPIKVFRANIQGTWNVLEGCRGKKYIKSVVVASSDKAYGIHDTLPYREDCELKGRYPYDVSKSCTDLLSHAYFHTYGLPVAVTRCGNVYGPGDFHFSRIVPDAIRSVLRGTPLHIRSDGTFRRDYIYIDDIVSGYIILAEKLQEANLHGETFNFSNEKPISVLKLVERIFLLSGKEPNYKILNNARFEIKDQYLASDKARKILGWRPEFALEEGLKRTIEWYRKEAL